MAWSIFHNPTTGSGTGTVSKDQGTAQAEGFAFALAQDLFGKNVTQGEVQFFYDQEIAEGGGGRFNPLNIGRDPKHPSWSGGSQYGGGASDYNSLTDALNASVDYYHMPNYQQITKDLQANNISKAIADLKKSPWAASHYSGGFPTTKLDVKISGGTIGPKPSDSNFALDVVKNIPHATAKVLGDVGSGAESAASGVVNVGSWLTKNLTIVLVVLVLIVIMKK